MPTRIPILLILFAIGFSGCNSSSESTTDTYDICVYGGTSAGVITAYAAAKMGKSVILIEPGKHLGGMTSGGLGQTDIGNKHAVTGMARQFYRHVGQHYGNFENWTFEPHVAEQVYQRYVKQDSLPVLYTHRIVSAKKDGAAIQSITVENALKPQAATNRTIRAKVFVDCSYEGDLMARAGVSYAVGREANTTHNETLNGVQLLDKHQFPEGIDPYVVPGDSTSGLVYGVRRETLAPNGTGDKKVQAYNFRMCLTNVPANRLPIPKPPAYDSTHYELLLRQMAKRGAWRSLDADLMHIAPMPNHKTDINNRGGMSTDFINESWEYPEASYARRAEIWQAHRNYMQGLFYFLGHDSRVPQHIRNEMRTWGFPKDEFRDTGGWPHQLYVREARRMIGAYVMTQHNCQGREVVNDGIALAAYTMDSHNCQRLVVNGVVKNEGDVQEGGFGPYPIAYRAITPKRQECTNLLVPVCLSASHIAYGSIRMEPVFMVLGQVCAVAASMAIDTQKSVQEIDVNALRTKIAADPLLDGTVPDVLVDDADSTMITTTGTWTKSEAFMQTYQATYTLGDTTKASGQFTFQPKFQQTGEYDVYYYCPNVRQGNLSEKLVVALTHAGGTDTLTVNMKQHAGSWAPLGRYAFRAGTNQPLVVVGTRSQKPLIADAALFIPVTETEVEARRSAEP